MNPVGDVHPPSTLTTLLTTTLFLTLFHIQLFTLRWQWGALSSTECFITSKTWSARRDVSKINVRVHSWLNLLLLVPLFFMSLSLLNNSLPCFPLHSHFTPILNLHFPQILSDITLPSQPRTTNPSRNWSPLCYSFHRPFFIHSYLRPNPSYSLHFYISSYIWVWLANLLPY